MDSELVTSFSRKTNAKAFCVYAFGQEKQLLKIQDSIYPVLLAACCNPKNRPLVIPQMPKGFIRRMKWLRGLYKNFSEVDAQLTALKNYQPQNTVQLKNILHSYYNLSRVQLGNLNAYQNLKDVHCLWRVALFIIHCIRRLFRYNTKPKMTYASFNEFVHSIHAVVGGFKLENKTYEIRSRVYPQANMVDSLRSTCTGLSHMLMRLNNDKKLERELINPNHMHLAFHDIFFEIKKTTEKYKKKRGSFQIGKPILSYEKKESKTLMKVKISFSPAFSSPISRRAIDEKLMQVMMEILQQNPSIETIRIDGDDISPFNHAVLAAGGFKEMTTSDRQGVENTILSTLFDTRQTEADPHVYPIYTHPDARFVKAEIQKDSMSTPNVYFNGSEATTWEAIIAANRILHHTGDFIPEWTRSMDIQE